MVQATVVQAGGEVGGRFEQHFEGHAAVGQGFVGGAEAGQIFRDDEAAAVGQGAEGDDGGRGDVLDLQGADAGQLLLGRRGAVGGDEAFYVQAAGLAVAELDVEVPVL